MNTVEKFECFWHGMWQRLNNMRQLWQLCDVTLITDDGIAFMAHSPVLAASCELFRDYFMHGVVSGFEVVNKQTLCLNLSAVTSTVLKVSLDFIYGLAPSIREDFCLLREGAAALKIQGALAFCDRVTQYVQMAIKQQHCNKEMISNSSELIRCPMRQIDGGNEKINEEPLSDSFHHGAFKKRLLCVYRASRALLDSCTDIVDTNMTELSDNNNVSKESCEVDALLTLNKTTEVCNEGNTMVEISLTDMTLRCPYFDKHSANDSLYDVSNPNTLQLNQFDSDNSSYIMHEFNTSDICCTNSLANNSSHSMEKSVPSNVTCVQQTAVVREPLLTTTTVNQPLLTTQQQQLLATFNESLLQNADSATLDYNSSKNSCDVIHVYHTASNDSCKEICEVPNDECYLTDMQPPLPLLNSDSLNALICEHLADVIDTAEPCSTKHKLQSKRKEQKFCCTSCSYSSSRKKDLQGMK